MVRCAAFALSRMRKVLSLSGLKEGALSVNVAWSLKLSALGEIAARSDRTSGVGLAVTTTSGDGVSVTPTAGSALVLTGQGTSKHAALLTGGTAGTSDGLKLVAGSGGVGLRLDTLTASGAVTLSSTLTVSGATTLTGLTTGALSCTTITASGAVAFQSTFAVTTSTSLAALSCTTLTASGAVAFQSTFVVTGATTLTGAVTASNVSNNIVGVALAASQHVIVDSGTVTTVTNQLTAAAIATGVWTDTTAGDFTVALSVGKSLMNGVTLGTGLTVARCTLTDTLTTYTGNTVQTGDSFARIGATGSGLTSLAQASAWTSTLATNLGTLAGHDPGATLGTSTLTAAQVLTTALTEAYAADGVAFTLSQALFMIYSAVMEFSIAGTTLTCKKLDGSTTAMTVTLDSSTAPTSRTRTG